MRTSSRTPVAARGPAAGFTLIELLAVIVILGILAAILVTSLGSAEESALMNLERTRLRQLATVVAEYETEFGDYPPSRLGDEAGVATNALNLGAEALVASLWSNGWEAGGSLSDEGLGNTDGDRSKLSITDFGVKDLFELIDSWENPIAYFHNADYGDTHLYLCFDPISGEPVETNAVARKNEKTGRWYNPQGFQLISAGPDGLFGTEDDLTSFGP